MTVREEVLRRMGEAIDADLAAAGASLPTALRRDRAGARLGLMQRLAAGRLFARGDRAGVLAAAGRRSGRAFKLDVRQRVVVKALVCRHHGLGAVRAGALAAHLTYLGRSGAGQDGERPTFFDAARESATPPPETRAWSEDRHHFRFIVSPEHGDRISDLRAYGREVMRRVADDLGEPELAWTAVCHFDTATPHLHVLIRGRRADGRDLVIPRDYVAYGFRARAQEVAQERLGDLSRVEAERRVWRETQADRFTALDRRLVAATDADGRVPDGVGATDAWAALSRGRLRRLEQLGLASRVRDGFRLDPELEPRLRRLQASRDVIRTFNQRRLEGAAEVRALGEARVSGHVAARGRHDELGAAPWVTVRDAAGVEHYARLSAGAEPPAIGQAVRLDGRGASAKLVLQRGAGLEL